MKSERRLEEVRRRMATGDLDALAINNAANVRYVTGFDDVFDMEPASVALVTASEARVYVDSRYHEAAVTAAEGTPWEVRGPVDDVWNAVLTELAAAGAEELGLESTLEHRRFVAVASQHEGTTHATEEIVEQVRVVKEGPESERVALAAQIADAAFSHVLERVRVGVTEREIALELEVFMRTNGAESVAFPPIVAGGPNSSRPHATCTDRPFERGDLIVLDFGARVGGYCSDMTRTLVLGTPSDAQRGIYAAVLDANRAGLGVLRAGLTGVQVDAAAREVIAARGFGDRFGHGLGHGVGLEVHEGPRLGPRGTQPLPAGSIVTVEPGVYVPGVGGVRIEDLAAVSDVGCTLLTHAPKDLIEL